MFKGFPFLFVHQCARPKIPCLPSSPAGPLASPDWASQLRSVSLPNRTSADWTFDVCNLISWAKRRKSEAGRSCVKLQILEIWSDMHLQNYSPWCSVAPPANPLLYFIFLGAAQAGRGAGGGRQSGLPSNGIVFPSDSEILITFLLLCAPPPAHKHTPHVSRDSRSPAEPLQAGVPWALRSKSSSCLLWPCKNRIFDQQLSSTNSMMKRSSASLAGG